VTDVAKAKESRKPPSRKRYEQEHPTVSFRLDRDTYKCLKGHLESTRCSFADFVKDALGREESMVEKRVELLASRQVDPLLEDRVRCLENLVHEFFSLTVDTDKYPPLCPRCGNQELCRCEGREMKSKLAQPWVITWKCPQCGFFMNTYNRIDPKSINWVAPDTWERIDKPKVSARHQLKKRRQHGDKDNR